MDNKFHIFQRTLTFNEVLLCCCCPPKPANGCCCFNCFHATSLPNRYWISTKNLNSDSTCPSRSVYLNFKKLKSSYTRNWRYLLSIASLQWYFRFFWMFSVRNNLLHRELKTGGSCFISKKINLHHIVYITKFAKIDILLKLLIFTSLTKKRFR